MDTAGETEVSGAGDTRRRRSAALIAVAAAVAVLVIAGVVGVVLSQSSSTSHRIGGTMLLKQGSISGKEGDSCYGEGGYNDIRAGASVTVSNGDGKLLATGLLGAGTQVYSSSGPSLKLFYCQFPVNVDTKVPRADFYKVEVTHRGAIAYSYDDMKSRDWQVALTLG